MHIKRIAQRLAFISRRRLMLTAGFLALLLFFPGGCLFLPSSETNRLQTENGVITDPAQPTTASSAAPTTAAAVSQTESIVQSEQSEESNTEAAASTTTVPIKTELDDTFDQRVRTIIIDSLEQRLKEIIVDPVFADYWITQDDVESTIDRFYQLYQQIYSENPNYFYLNGSVMVNYTMLTGQQSRIKSLSLLPQYWTQTDNLSVSELSQLIARMDRVVDTIASEIRGQTSQSWQQLQLLHNLLIRSIEYDSSENQENNHAMGALLDGKTLCQGYAQAFQLVGQRLGFDIRMITGTSDGQGHAWNLVFLDGLYFHVDVTHDDPLPDSGSDHPIRHIHFMRSDAIMRQSHQWNAADYPAALQDGAHYYRNNNFTAQSHPELSRLIEQKTAEHDFPGGSVMLLEVLYTGADLPGRDSVDDMLKDALQINQINERIYYRLQVSKSVILLEIST